MKRILIAVALLAVASVASAEAYRPMQSSYTATANPYSSVNPASVAASYTQVVRIVSAVDVYVSIGATPISTTATGMFVPAYVPEYFNVGAGEGVAVLSVSATGTVYISDMTK